MIYHTIAESLHPLSVATELKGTTKDAILAELVTLLEKSGKVTDRRAVLSALTEREKVASTAIAGGIAMPHAKTTGVSDVCMAVGICRDGVYCGAPDGIYTRIFVLAASPDDPTSSYLTTLVNLINLFKDENTCKQLMQCHTNQAVYEMLVAHDRKMLDIDKEETL